MSIGAQNHQKKHLRNQTTKSLRSKVRAASVRQAVSQVAANEMNSFSQSTGRKSSSKSPPPHYRRARRHRNTRRHLHRPLLTRFTNDFDLLQAILARQIVPANNCNADQGRRPFKSMEIFIYLSDSGSEKIPNQVRVRAFRSQCAMHKYLPGYRTHPANVIRWLSSSSVPFRVGNISVKRVLR